MLSSELQTLDVNVASAETRRCYKCGEERPLAMFYVDVERKRALREGRGRWHAPCRVCQRKTNDARRKPRQDYLDAIKLERGCTDCGIKSEHPEVYDFDHLPGEGKVSAVSTSLTKGTWEEMLVEIAKCEVVCANCHRIRTRAREKPAFGQTRKPRK